jgi:predicted phosphodiesterase
MTMQAEDKAGSPTIAQHRVTLAVVSDLHAYVDGDPPGPSSLSISLAEDEPTRHPITGLRRLLEDLQAKADILVSCGDMGDKAHPAAIQYAWKALQSIGQTLSVRLIAAASGNHDLDSRHNHNEFDAKGHLQALVPPFPLPEEERNDRYWARHFVIAEDCGVSRVVILNSCAYHGTGAEEYEHGRIARSTIDRLRHSLKCIEPPPVNIFVCHHHPERHGEPPLSDRDDYEAMTNGPGLIELLGSGDVGEWLVIHGHRHRPRLFYAQGATCPPVVLSAGSLCGHIDSVLQGYARNQFYLVEIDVTDSRKWGLSGTFRAWDWIPAQGWIPAGAQSGLPSSGGFGWRETPVSIAAAIADRFVEVTVPFFYSWDRVVSIVPRLRYIMPRSVPQIAGQLRQRHGFQVTEEGGRILEIGRQA